MFDGFIIVIVFIRYVNSIQKQPSRGVLQR